MIYHLIPKNVKIKILSFRRVVEGQGCCTSRPPKPYPPAHLLPRCDRILVDLKFRSSVKIKFIDFIR